MGKANVTKPIQKTTRGGLLPSSSWPSRRMLILISAALATMTLAIYWRATSFDFVDLDDFEYVLQNPHVRDGLTLNSIEWAFNIGYAANWHPLTWLSHMLDGQLYGMTPGQLHGTGGHHLTSILFHVANSVLLFLFFVRLTHSLWPSALVAALFAIHPLHVESVVWVSERKDVLSTFFMILTLWAYLWYRERRNVQKYILVALLFAAALMAKQMVVTLPFLLLLLDFWPACLVSSPKKFWQLFAEKLPLLALSLAAGLIAIKAQASDNALAPTGSVSMVARITTAVVAYVAYLGNTFWPRNLACYYADTGVHWNFGQIGGGALLLVGTTYFAIRLARRHPYFFVGWIWYLVTLLPVIGLLQIGGQARADRYTYVPLIGLFVIIAFAASELLSKCSKTVSRTIAAVLALVIVGALSLQAYAQVGYWQTNETLWNHTLAVTKDNWFAHQAMATILNNQADALRTSGQATAADKKKSGSDSTSSNHTQSQTDPGECSHRPGQCADGGRKTG